jgi:hypothetical protein
MAEQLPRADGSLPACEFRPVACNRRIQIELALAGQLQGGDGGEGLGAGKQVGMVSLRQAWRASLSALPAHRSTTVSPPTWMHSAARVAGRRTAHERSGDGFEMVIEVACRVMDELRAEAEADILPAPPGL